MKSLRPSFAAAACCAAIVLSLAAPALRGKENEPSLWREPGWGIARTVVVSPGNLRGWTFSPEAHPEGVFHFATGPVTPAMPGAGGLVTGISQTGQRSVFATGACAGVRLSELTALKYTTMGLDGGAVPVLQMDMDFDLRDAAQTLQGVLVYEPALNGTVTTGTWQTWEALAGKWDLVPSADTSAWAGAANTPFPRTAPATLAEIRAQFPRAGIRRTGSLALSTGGIDTLAFTAVVDTLTAGHRGGVVTWNFEPDSDGDSVPDFYDAFAFSDLRDKVDAGTGVTTVDNAVDTNGASIQDRVNKIGATTTTLKKYTKGISSLVSDLQKARVITQVQGRELKTASEQTVPGYNNGGTLIIMQNPSPVIPGTVGGAFLEISPSAVGGGSLVLFNAGNGTILNAGTLNLNGAMTATGGVPQRPDAGQLTVNGGIVNLQPGTLNTGGIQVLTIGGLSGTGGTITSDTPAGLVIQQNGGDLNFGGNVAAAVALTKTGTGTLTLSGANTYSGATAVNAGTLIVTGTMANTASLSVAAGAVMEIPGARTVTLSGSITNNGTLRICRGATLDARNATTFVNNGVLDLISGTALLPAGFTNGPNGMVLDSSSVSIRTITRAGDTVTLTIQGYTGHAYQLQRADSPAGPYSNAGTPQNGNTGTDLIFSVTEAAGLHGFYRVVVDG